MDAPFSRSLCRCFVGRRCALLLQQEAKLVDTVQQAVAREGIDREINASPRGQLQGAPLQIDADFAAGIDRSARSLVALIDDDGQQAVLQRVVAEDVGDLGADDRAEAVIQQCPGRVFARGAAAEIAARPTSTWQPAPAAGSDEVGLWVPSRIAPVGKQLLAEAGPGRGGAGSAPE
jgi:hypothetical protein